MKDFPSVSETFVARGRAAITRQIFSWYSTTCFPGKDGDCRRRTQLRSCRYRSQLRSCWYRLRCASGAGVYYIPSRSGNIFAGGDDHSRHTRVRGRVPKQSSFHCIPGTVALSTGGRAVIAVAGCPHRSRSRVMGTGHLGKGEIAQGSSG